MTSEAQRIADADDAPSPIGRAGAALKDAYNYIKAPHDPPFEDIDSSQRVLALAAAMVAAEPLLKALRAIRAMETPCGNATVRRMARLAAKAINDAR
jgi:hypothetical protein